MYVEIITPDKKVFAGEALQVIAPGSEGSFEVLPQHASLISVLQAGNISVKTKDGVQTFAINGGVAEVLNNQITLLTEALVN